MDEISVDREMLWTEMHRLYLEAGKVCRALDKARLPDDANLASIKEHFSYAVAHLLDAAILVADSDLEVSEIFVKKIPGNEN